MTLLIASIPVDSILDLTQRADRAWAKGATAVELRIDTFDGDPCEVHAFLRAHPNRTWIVTCRSAGEGGHFRGNSADRVSRILAVARGADVCVDFEWSDWKRSAGIRHKIGLAVERTVHGDRRLILSSHDFQRRPPRLGGTIAEIIAAQSGSIAKVAYRAEHICESFDALDAMHQYRDALIGIAMGEDGIWSRVLAAKLGAFGTYCALDDDKSTAPGQCTLDEMIEQYRWEGIDKDTKVFGVLGDPVAHSMSPVLFNRWFREAKLNAVYLPLRVRVDGGGLARFLESCRSRPWLDIGGFSVTIPHKTAALEWVDGQTDERCKRIGAINTLSFKDGQVRGLNTDSIAAMDSMIAALGRTPTKARGLTVDVLGTGGVARAVLAGLQALGCDTVVYGRTADRTQAIAGEFGATPAEWQHLDRRAGSVVINCTSVGMWPDVDATPLTATQLGGCSLVFDIVYRPLETRLLSEAAKVGAATLGGLDMFVGQAALQMEQWTGVRPDRASARDWVAREINTRSKRSS
ncbi:MAG: type I 3-dehydroquinate dehydratase [Planctomycetes bacterium]|nr:type I 3-dehydroquinate dehydratase [Planctomycetota bacterium]